MTHSPGAHRALPPRNRPRPRPRSPEPRPLLPRVLSGTDEPSAPATVRASFALWLTAVAAGVFETVLAVIRAVAEGDASAGVLTGGPALRVAGYAAAVLVAVRMRRGGGWARAALVGAAAVLGTLALISEPDAWPTDGQGIGETLRNVDVVDVLLGGSRVLHLAAVVMAVALMFRRSANAWFRAGR